MNENYYTKQKALDLMKQHPTITRIRVRANGTAYIFTRANGGLVRELYKGDILSLLEQCSQVKGTTDQFVPVIKQEA